MPLHYNTLLNNIELEKLYRKYERIMYYKAYDILGDRYLAEDAVHDSFISISSNMQIIIKTDYSKIRPLLLTIIRNKAIDLRRKRRIRNSLDLVEITQPQNSPKEKYLLKDIIKELPYEYRVLLKLKYYYGYTYKEISKILKTNVHTVGIRMKTAKEILQLKINEEN